MQKRGLIHSKMLVLLVSAGIGLGVTTSDALAASAGLFPAAEGGKIRAFIVGIDDYTAKKRLQGAVADARDIEQSLKELGVPPENMTVLIDQQATRKNFQEGIERLVRDAKAHDLVIISFAGHGAQLPEMHKNTKPDGKDEVYVLAKFDETVKTGFEGAGPRPRDKALAVGARQKGADVLFIADTCHGGGLTRAVDFRQQNFSYRLIDINKAALAEDTLEPASTPADATLTESSFSSCDVSRGGGPATARRPKSPSTDKNLSVALSVIRWPGRCMARPIRMARARSPGGNCSNTPTRWCASFPTAASTPITNRSASKALDTVVFRTTRSVEIPSAANAGGEKWLNRARRQ